MSTWYDFRANAGNPTDVFIYDGIGAYGVSAQAFIADLAKHQGKDLNLRINSPGGSVTDASAMFNAIRRHTGAVTAQIDGLAASAATFVACAAGKIRMAANSLFMIHDPAAAAGGGSTDLRRLADVLDKITNAMASVYAAKTKKPEAVIRAAMSAETWFSADEAKTYGFVDEITDAINVTASFDLSSFAHVPAGAHRFGTLAGDLTPRERLAASTKAELALSSGRMSDVDQEQSQIDRLRALPRP